MKRGKFVFIIPVYNHEHRVRDVAEAALGLGIPVLVVDDGSTDKTFETIKDVRGIKVIRHGENMGKGAAILTGLREAAGFAEWGITIDADGQHNPGDAAALIEAIPEGRSTVVVGKRQDMFGPDVPWTSRFGRGFSNFWVWCSGGPMISDSQSGFRIYPVKDTLALNVKSMRFQFEVEVLVKANWSRIPVVEVPISVTYTPGMERISHFRPFVDFMRNSRTFCRLIFQRIFIPGYFRGKTVNYTI